MSFLVPETAITNSVSTYVLRVAKVANLLAGSFCLQQTPSSSQQFSTYIMMLCIQTVREKNISIAAKIAPEINIFTQLNHHNSMSLHIFKYHLSSTKHFFCKMHILPYTKKEYATLIYCYDEKRWNAHKQMKIRAFIL